MTAAEPELITKHALWFKPADSLIRALSNGLLFAGSDMTLPMLAAVKFEFDGTQLEVLTTDRYRACIEVVELDREVSSEDQAPFQFLLARDAVKYALAFIKTHKREAITLIYNEVTGTVRFNAYDNGVEYRTLDAAFPSLRTLFPPISGVKAVDRIGFTRNFLADLGKVLTPNPGRNDAISVRTFGTRSTLIEFVDGGPRVLLMPRRLPE